MAIKLDFRQEINKRDGKILEGIELLECGHQNNLLIPGRVTGVCPKGCTKDDKGNISKFQII